VNFWTDFRKILSGKFSENPSSGIRVVPCGRMDGQTVRQSETHTWRNW